MRDWRRLSFWLEAGLIFLSLSSSAAASQNIPGEEGVDYFKKWLSQDVVYIITSEEKEVFQKLSTLQEKESFIEQFWQRRDPDLRTQINEFKEEHYRRIAYANEHFTSGFPGWKTDRGMVYIKYGRPDELDSNASGGSYERRYEEGGGRTSTFPFEVWWYRHIDGVGDDVEIEFVDPTMSGEYRIARDPDEKDAFLLTPGLGPTLAEQFGYSSRRDRLKNRSLSNPPETGFSTRRAKDQPFQKLRQLINLQRPQPIRFNDLRQIVTSRVSYEQLALMVREDVLRVDQTLNLITLTIAIPNSELTYHSGGKFAAARVNVFGSITDLANSLVFQFEDVMSSEYSLETFPLRARQKSLYQKPILISPGTYKLSLAVQDRQSGRLSILERRLSSPSWPEKLTVSRPILSNNIRLLDGPAESFEPFVIGDVKIYPNMEHEFRREEQLGVYLQVYNFHVDQSSDLPSLRLHYKIFQQSRMVHELTDSERISWRFLSDQRLVLLKAIPLELFEPGEYQLQISVEDEVAKSRTEVAEGFRIIG